MPSMGEVEGPEAVAKMARSYTGGYLKGLLGAKNAERVAAE